MFRGGKGVANYVCFTPFCETLNFLYDWVQSSGNSSLAVTLTQVFGRIPPSWNLKRDSWSRDLQCCNITPALNYVLYLKWIPMWANDQTEHLRIHTMHSWLCWSGWNSQCELLNPSQFAAWCYTMNWRTINTWNTEAQLFLVICLWPVFLGTALLLVLTQQTLMQPLHANKLKNKH